MGKKSGLFFIGALLFLAACTKKAGQPAPSTTPSMPQPEATDVQEQGNLSRPISDMGEVLTKGKALEGLAAVGEDSPYYCNLEDNLRGRKSASTYRVLVCKDPVYDITYYVNYGQDYYIYAMRGGASELAVELPATELYCKGGELYFMVDTYGLYELNGLSSGNILKYNPADGSLAVVVAEPAAMMAVYPDGICYLVTGEMTQLEGGRFTISQKRFYYSFEEQESREIETWHSMERWKANSFVEDIEIVEGQLGVDFVGVHLENQEGETVHTLKELTKLPESYVVRGNQMYYVQGGKFLSCNLETGEVSALAELAVETIAGYDDFIIQDEVVYFSNCLRLSLTDGKQYYTLINGRSVGPDGRIEAFYTDGENLYCINANRLWRVTDNRIPGSDDTDPLNIKQFVKGRDVLVNCYEYVLEPLG